MDRRSIITLIFTALLSLSLISAAAIGNQQENDLAYPDNVYGYYQIDEVPEPSPAKRAQTFVRFGKRAQTFVRFGKRAQTFVRFG